MVLPSSPTHPLYTPTPRDATPDGGLGATVLRMDVLQSVYNLAEDIFAAGLSQGPSLHNAIK